MKDKDDDALVALGLTGSAEALEELYARHRAPILGYAYRMTGDRALAEDVLQNTFVYFFERLKRYEPRGLLGAYLFRIARSFATDEKAAARRARPVPGTVPSMPEEDREAASALEEKARQALLALPTHLREVVELRLYQGFDYARVAEIAGVSEATARSRMRYGLEALRAALGVAPQKPEKD